MTHCYTVKSKKTIPIAGILLVTAVTMLYGETVTMTTRAVKLI